MATEEETIAEILRETMNEGEGETETPEPETEQEVSDPEPEVEAEAAATEDESDEEPEKVFQAPEHWSSDDKEHFSSLAPEAQELVMKFEGDFKKGYQERVQGISDIEKALEPWKQSIVQRGVSEADAIRMLFATQAQIEQDPVNGVLALAQRFGVLDQLRGQFAPDTDDDFTDPEVKALRQQIQELRANQTQFQQQAQTDQNQALQTQIDTFKGETDAEGNLVHPYFDDVRTLMAPLVAEGKSMKEAYDEAVWSVPAYRETHLKATQAEKKEKDELEKARKVKQAKKASNAIKQTGKESPADTEDEALSLEDELKAAWKQAQS